MLIQISEIVTDLNPFIICFLQTYECLLLCLVNNIHVSTFYSLFILYSGYETPPVNGYRMTLKYKNLN